VAVAFAPNDTPSEREQLLAAERDAALESVRALIRVLAAIGGHMTHEQQAAYREAKALVGIGPVAQEWRNRG
jgi:hypothetical protein